MVDEPSAAPSGAMATSSVAVRDERGDLSSAFVGDVRNAIQAGDAAAVRALAGDLHESDLADLIETIEQGERIKLIRLLGEDFDFTTLTEVDETIRAQLLEEFPPSTLADAVLDLESDDAVTILEDLKPAEQAAILAEMPATERLALARSLDYPEESAGRLMQTDFIAVPPFWSVGQTIDHMRETTDLPDEFYELFVVDPAFRPIGTVVLNRLLRAKRPTSIADLADEVHPVAATDDQEAVARVFERYNLVSAPIVDEAGRMLGVVTIDDVVDVIEAEADEDLRALGGVGSEEELSDNFWTIARGRFGWLLVNLGTAILASMVIGLFEDQLRQMVALAVLMPIVASQGGNAGVQTMTVTVRALATREIGPHNALRLIGRELLVGVLNGLAFAVIMGAVAYVWFRAADLGVVIALAMLVNLVAAALGGILVPLALDRLKADPAVSSSAFVTTVTDVVGFFAFLGIAAWWFGIR